MVRLQLILTCRDANLDLQRIVIVSSLLEGLKINFCKVIVDELFVRACKIASVFLFPYIITKLCKLTKVPIISGVDNKVGEMKKQDIEKTRDETKFEMRVHKLESFGI